MAVKQLQIGDLKALVEQRQWPCVSLCLPTHRAGRPEMREGPIRLKNAVSAARERLAQAGYPKDRSAALLEPTAGLIASRDFWLHQSDGLAIFAAPDSFQYYRLPLRLQEEVVVADHFSVKQLIPLFSEDGRFFILALSQKQVRFFEATRTSIQEHEVPDMLKGIEDLRQFDEAQEQLQGHTVAMAQQAGGISLAFHGQGGLADKAQYKADVARYITVVSKKLEKHLDAETAPLVLAAVEYEQSLYRQANSYHHLLEEGVLGNPDGLEDGQLQREAWEIVEPHFAAAKETSLAHFADLSGTGKTSDRLEEILPAACHGRVRTLFLQAQAHVWGTFDAQTLVVERHDPPTGGDVDLIDQATVCVLQNKGMIYVLPREEMPVEVPVAALFRY